MSKENEAGETSMNYAAGGEGLTPPAPEKADTPRCPQCGTPLYADDRFCAGCGTAVQARPAAPAPASAPPASTPAAANAAPAGPATKKKIIAVCISVAALAAGLIFLNPFSSSQKPAPNTPQSVSAENPPPSPQPMPAEQKSVPPASPPPAPQAMPAEQQKSASAVKPKPPSSPPPAPKQPANMVRINGGTFTMGSPNSEPEREKDEIQHSVTLSSFYMGKYEVTQREWRQVMGSNPSKFKGDNLPVETVSWYDAVEYCNKRSRKEGLTPAYTINGTDVTWNRNADGYRLPTEAEWEYACRAGTTTPYYTGGSVEGAGWYHDDKTHPAGQKKRNAWGLYDMHGNVREWCWDRYADYLSGARTNPAGAETGVNRVSRGGSWLDYARSLRSAYRNKDTPAERNSRLGFRLARSRV